MFNVMKFVKSILPQFILKKQFQIIVYWIVFFGIRYIFFLVTENNYSFTNILKLKMSNDKKFFYFIISVISASVWTWLLFFITKKLKKARINGKLLL